MRYQNTGDRARMWRTRGLVPDQIMRRRELYLLGMFGQSGERTPMDVRNVREVVAPVLHGRQKARTAVTYPRLTPDQLNAIVAKVVGNVEIDALQVMMLGPWAVEVKARRAHDSQWFQGVVKL